MANLTELTQWELGIYQLETEDPVLGGPDGIDNLQAKQLGNRTQYLKQQIELAQGDMTYHLAAPDPHAQYALDSDLTAHVGAADPHPQYVTSPELQAAIDALVAAAPGALDTLNELATALGNDPNFAATITAALALKAPWAAIDPVLTQAGLTIDHGNLNQLRDAIQLLINSASGAGKHTIWVPAGAITPRITNGAALGVIETTTNKIMVRTLDYDQATAEYGQFSIRMPKSWNEGAVTAYLVWSNASGTGNVVWGVQAVAISDDDVLDAAFGAAQTVTDGVTAAGDLMQTAETPAITIAGTPSTADMVIFQVYRDAANGSDTLAADARLHGIAIIYTTDAGNDA